MLHAICEQCPRCLSGRTAATDEDSDDNEASEATPSTSTAAEPVQATPTAQAASSAADDTDPISNEPTDAASLDRQSADQPPQPAQDTEAAYKHADAKLSAIQTEDNKQTEPSAGNIAAEDKHPASTSEQEPSDSVEVAHEHADANMSASQAKDDDQPEASTGNVAAEDKHPASTSDQEPSGDLHGDMKVAYEHADAKLSAVQGGDTDEQGDTTGDHVAASSKQQADAPPTGAATGRHTQMTLLSSILANRHASG